MVIGLGSMIGAGIFAALGPAAAAAGSGLLVGLAVAAVVAYCNATPRPGWPPCTRSPAAPMCTAVNGWAILGVSGRLGVRGRQDRIVCSDGADRRRLRVARPRASVAVIAVVALTAVNYRGVQKSALLTRVIVAVVLAVLAFVVVVSLSSDQADVARLDIGADGTHRRGAAGRRAVVLRLRRVRPDRHARRGGPRPRPHHPARDPAGAGHHPGRLRCGRGRGAGGAGRRGLGASRPRWPTRSAPPAWRPGARGADRRGDRRAGLAAGPGPGGVAHHVGDGPRPSPAARAGRGPPAVQGAPSRRAGRRASSWWSPQPSICGARSGSPRSEC